MSATQAACFVVSPGSRVGGDVRVPGDKSISHRAAMLAAIAEGASDVHGFLESEDCLATLRALDALGVVIERPTVDCVRIRGSGLRGLQPAGAPLDLGNSGTAMRLLAGVLAGQPFDSTLVGDASLMRRPMERVAVPLRRMGAAVSTDGGRPPVRIAGGRALRGCEHLLEIPSAQVKSAILLAGLQAEGRTSVQEPALSRDHTERMLPVFGVELERSPLAASVVGPARPRAASVHVPGDFSSAAFLIAAGLLAGQAPLTIRNVGVNPTRIALLGILRDMGADVRVIPVGDECEPTADLEVRQGRLRGVQVAPSLVPAAIDELPLLFALAAVADGETVVAGASELRVKESDRLAAMAAGLRALGVTVEPLPDGLRVQGGRIGGGTVDSHGDHRVAMAFAVLAARARAPVVIRDVQNVATSFPGFAATMQAAGLRIRESA